MPDHKSDDKGSPGEQMLDEMMQRAGVTADAKGNMSIPDAVRLKLSINQDIRYCGFNAREIAEKKKITSDEWSEARKWYEELVKTYGYRLRPVGFLMALGLAVAGYFLGEWRPHIEIVLAVLIVWIAYKLGQAEAYNAGFFTGFENGFEAGIDKLLGIDKTESEEIRERAIEMESDERLIGGFEKKERSG